MIRRSTSLALIIAAAWLSGMACKGQTQVSRQTQTKNSAPSLRFMAFGDWGTNSPQQKRVAEAMAQYATRHQGADAVQFVVSLGDNFYEHGVTDVDDPQWQTKFEQMYDKQRLPMPFIAVLGNHDWHLNPVAQIAYARSNPGTRWQMDGFWFKRQYFLPAATGTSTTGRTPLADFFFIDTDL